MIEDWEARFKKDYVNYVNATIAFMEISNDKNSIIFEEEMEWIVSWFKKELDKQST